jgi:hypothetical protein
MWNFKDGFTDEQNINNARKVKEELEALRTLIPGIISLEVVISTLPSGNRDIVLNSLFENELTLAEYQIHPEHVRVGQHLGTFVQNRTCADYYEE